MPIETDERRAGRLAQHAKTSRHKNRPRKAKHDGCSFYQSTPALPFFVALPAILPPVLFRLVVSFTKIMVRKGLNHIAVLNLISAAAAGHSGQLLF